MGFVKLGKTTLYKNTSATEDNKQPHFRGDIEVDFDIPAGTKIGLAGWLNEQGNKRSLFFALSCKEEDIEEKEEDQKDLPF